MRAATQLFAARGFEGTSTRDVAKKARVNESTIFRLFKNKHDLYLQILDSTMGLGASEWLRPVLRTSDDPEQVFLALAGRLQELFNPMFLRLLFFAALEKPELLHKRYTPGLLSFYQTLGRHIQEKVENETLRNIDPLLMGQALVGMIAYDRIVRDLFRGCDDWNHSLEDTSKIYTDIFLFGASSWKSAGRHRRAE